METSGSFLKRMRDRTEIRRRRASNDENWKRGNRETGKKEIENLKSPKEMNGTLSEENQESGFNKKGKTRKKVCGKCFLSWKKKGKNGTRYQRTISMKEKKRTARQ